MQALLLECPAEPKSDSDGEAGCGDDGAPAGGIDRGVG
jgi:hypothetical protein